MATRFVIGQAVNKVPSIVDVLGLDVVMRIRAPIALLNASSDGVVAAPEPSPVVVWRSYFGA